MLTGARLAFVVVALEGTVKRNVAKWDKKTRAIVQTPTVQPAGYLVYFPQGHVLRFKTEADLTRYGLNRKPNIINMQGLHDPNSPIGKMLHAQDEETRQGAYGDLEQQVIRLATAKTGTLLMPEQQHGYAEDEAVAA